MQQKFTADKAEFMDRLTSLEVDDGGSFKLNRMAVKSGVTYSSLKSLFDNSPAELRRPALLKICKAYSISPDWLVTGRGNKALGLKIDDAEINIVDGFHKRIKKILKEYTVPVLAKRSGIPSARFNSLSYKKEPNREMLAAIGRETNKSLLHLMCGQGYEDVTTAVKDNTHSYSTSSADQSHPKDPDPAPTVTREIFRRIMSAYPDLKHYQDVATFIGAQETTASNLASRPKPPYQLLVNWAIKEGINLNWVFTGQGSIKRTTAIDEATTLPLCQTSARLFDQVQALDPKMPSERFMALLQHLEKTYLKKGVIPTIGDVKNQIEYSLSIMDSYRPSANGQQ